MGVNKVKVSLARFKAWPVNQVDRFLILKDCKMFQIIKKYFMYVLIYVKDKT